MTVLRAFGQGASLRYIAALLMAPAGGAPALAQDAEFDSPRVLSLVRQARELRETSRSRTASVAYKARAEGHIYFYLDRDDGGEPVPMRVDQVAVDVYRSADGRTRQDIRALRRQEFLPVQDFRYYIDRLTAVQNGFGNRISIGEGRDVRDVPHPLGSQGEDTYRFRMTDSIRISAPTLPRPVTVHEIEVQPRDEGLPGFTGSVFVESRTGALVRMVFTFTPASYVDPRSDRITVRLEHARWTEDQVGGAPVAPLPPGGRGPARDPPARPPGGYRDPGDPGGYGLRVRSRAGSGVLPRAPGDVGALRPGRLDGVSCRPHGPDG